MKKKIKLRDMTEDQFVSWCKDNCPNNENLNTRIDCNRVRCPFAHVLCNERDTDNCWLYNKEDFSDKFLDQEVEIEVPNILTEEEKEYLEAVIKPFKPCILFVSKNESDNPNEYIGIFCKKSGYEKFLLSCFPTSPSMRFDGLENDKHYTLEDLGL